MTDPIKLSVPKIKPEKQQRPETYQIMVPETCFLF